MFPFLRTRGAIFLVLTLAAAKALSQVPGLQEKLDHQFQLYDQARELLVTRSADLKVPVAQRWVDRKTWETVLTPQPAMALTGQDLDALKAWQRTRIQAARMAAEKTSVLDLNGVRKNGTAKEFCQQFPKGGMLHVHPSGTFDHSFVRSVLIRTNPALEIPEFLREIDDSKGQSILYPEERLWLEQLPAGSQYLSLSPFEQSRFLSFFFLPPGKQPFERFETVFGFLGYVVPDYQTYQEALIEFAKRAAAQGVFYVEFTTGGGAAMVPIWAEVEKQTGVMIRVNGSFNRRKEPEQLDQDVNKLLASAPSPYLVGIDLLANEGPNPALEKGQIVYGAILAEVRAGRSHLHRTMHAGEIGDIRNPRDAMIMGAERLGHGVNLAKDIVTLEYAIRQKTAVEVNLTSNLRLTDVASVSTHPFLDYLRLGLPVSLSTDDEGIFETDINHECELAIQETDLTYAELRQMAINSIETSFASDADKAQLLMRLTQALVNFEKAQLSRPQVYSIKD